MSNFTGVQYNSNFFNNQTGFNSPLNQSYAPSPYAGVQYNPTAPTVGMPNGSPQPQGGGGPNALGVVTAGLGAIGTGMNIAQDYKQASQFDVEGYLPNQTYNPRSAVPVYQEMATPEEISEGTGSRAMMNYGGQGLQTGAALGAAFGGPAGAGVGAAIGAGIGLLGGALLGSKKGEEAAKKRAEFERRQDQQKKEYGKALNRYYSIQNTKRMEGARDMMTAQRGANLDPYFNANIYGF